MPKVKQSTIWTLQYVTEAILIYFILFPIGKWFDFYISAPNYLVWILVSAIAFFLGSIMTVTYAPYVVAVPIVVLAGIYLLSISPIFTILLTILLTYRFIKQLTENNEGKEKNIFIASFLFAIADAIFFSSDTVIWLVFLQLVFLLISQFYKHYVSEQEIVNANHEKSQSLLKGPLLIASVVVPSLLILLFLFDYINEAISYLLSFIGTLLYYVMAAFVWLVGLTGLDLSFLTKIFSPIQSDMKIDMENMKKNQLPPSDTSYAGENLDNIMNVMYWVAIGVGVLIAIIVAVIYFKRKVDVVHAEQTQMIRSTKYDSGLYKKKRKRGFGRFSRKPDDIARKMFYEFEEFARKKGFGRMSSETIEEWFNRCQFPVANIELYQKVRYGEAELTKVELQNYKNELEVLYDNMKRANN